MLLVAKFIRSDTPLSLDIEGYFMSQFLEKLIVMIISSIVLKLWLKWSQKKQLEEDEENIKKDEFCPNCGQVNGSFFDGIRCLNCGYQKRSK